MHAGAGDGIVLFMHGVFYLFRIYQGLPSLSSWANLLVVLLEIRTVDSKLCTNNSWFWFFISIPAIVDIM